MSAVEVGNVFRSTVAFVPSEGTVATVDVTVRLLAPDGTETDLTSSLQADGDNEFYVDIEVAADAVDGLYRVRWESADGSPVIAVENESTTFVVLASRFSTS